MEWTLDFISMKSSYLVTHSSHFLRINSVAISKQVVVSEVKASVLITIQVPRMCQVLFLKNNLLQKANKSNLKSEVSINQWDLVSLNKNDRPLPILYVTEKEKEREWKLLFLN